MNLTEKVLAYQAGTYAWEELYRNLYQHCTALFTSRNYELAFCHELFFYSLARLQTMAQRFVYMDKPFEFYLNKCLMFQARSFQRKRDHQSRREKTACFTAARLGIMPLVHLDRHGEAAHADCLAESCPPISRRGLAASYQELANAKKGYLLVALHNFMALEDDDWLALARYLGADPAWIYHCVDQLRACTVEQFNRKSNRANTSYCMYLYRQSRKLKNPDHPEWLEKPRFLPLHRDIARILGISKGTVHSVLFNCRKRLEQQERAREDMVR